jgi:uncharacterized protein YdhG (YjbR/CyaY superfamily)
LTERGTAEEVATYVEAIPVEHRELFERVHALVVEACPEASVGLAYNMPAYSVGRRRLSVGAWAHGVSIYGWKRYGDGGFTARHPDLRTSTGTIRLTPEDAAAIEDDEIRALARAALLD